MRIEDSLLPRNWQPAPTRADGTDIQSFQTVTTLSFAKIALDARRLYILFLAPVLFTDKLM